MYVKVIADSVAKNGKRITTLECKYWRAIHAEVMTHRAFARNAASSRAIPFYKTRTVNTGVGDELETKETVIENCTYSMLKNDPFFPKYIGAEQKGMQSGEQLTIEQMGLAENIIADMLRHSLKKCKELYDLGVHKSIINRYLEPWSYITTLITATEWNNFYALRIHPAAEKHFNELAVEMKLQMSQSVPTETDYHLPYILPEEKPEVWGSERFAEKLKVLQQMSVARCSRLSYLTQDGVKDAEKDLAQYERLLHPGDGVMHASPFEHVATATMYNHSFSGPFRGWYQLRKSFEHECVKG